MDFKKVFISVSVAFFTVIIDIVFDTAYLFPLIVISLLSYFLMKYFDEAHREIIYEKQDKATISETIPECNVKFFKSILKEKVKDFESNRFLTAFLKDKVKELEKKEVDYEEISIKNLTNSLGLNNSFAGKLFARRDVFENGIHGFLDFLKNEEIKYSIDFYKGEKGVCKTIIPTLFEITIPEVKLSDRQIGIILIGKAYKGRVKLVEHLFLLRKSVEEAGGFFVVVRENGIKVFCGFASVID